VTQADSTSDAIAPHVGDWTLNPDQTSVAFRTKAMWVMPVTGTVKALSGEGHVAADGSLHGTLVLNAVSISTKNKKRDAHLRTADFFEVDTYPTLTFTADGGRLTGAGEAEITGVFTVHGRSQPLTLQAKVNSSGNTTTVSTTIEIDRSQWGLNWAKMGAGLKNQVEIHAHFDRA
jgi:polyisoprenoid-binding protein YceI